MENSELDNLIVLLENPTALKIKIESLKTTDDLKEEVEGFIKLYDFYSGDCLKIKKYLRESKNSIKLPLIKKHNRTISFLKYAAIFIIVLGIVALLRDNQKNINTSLRNQFKEPGLTNYMGCSNATNWEYIMFDYKTKNNKIALQKIKKEQIKNKANDTLIYFSGVIYYEMNNLEAASKEFQKIVNSTSIFKDRALYYIGTIEYKNGNSEKAKKIFQSLRNSADLDVKNSSSEHVNELEPQ